MTGFESLLLPAESLRMLGTKRPSQSPKVAQ